MKLTNKTLTWLIAGMVSIALITSASAQTTKERTGKVVRIKGAARYSAGNKTWQPLKVGTILKPGSVVQTAADSYADIVLNEDATADAVSMPHPAATPASAAASGGGGGGNKAAEHDVVRVQSDSVLGLDKLTATDTGADRVTETELDLRTGSIFCSVKKQAAASRFEVKLPHGIAGIRGTFTLIFANGNIICGTGSVVSASTDDAGKVTTKVVPGGSQLNGATGQTSPIGGALLGTLQSLAQDTSYGTSGGNGAEFINVQNRGREQVSETNP
jgi:hypothetical protein